MIAIDSILKDFEPVQAAKRFLGKVLRGREHWEAPEAINTDKAPSYGVALRELKREGRCPMELKHSQVKYLNNIIESDHGKLKRLIKSVRGFKKLKTAYATIRGFEVMRMIKKGQMDVFTGGSLDGEIRLIERQFGIYSD